MTLRKWIYLENLTQEQAAKRLRVPVGTLRGWLYQGKVPHLGTLRRIAKVTGQRVTWSDWFDDDR